MKKTLREFGLRSGRPTNSESRSESCSENRASHELGRECHSEGCSENAPEFRELLREWPFRSESLFFKVGVVPRLGKSNGGLSEGGFSNNRIVLKPDVAIASEVSILSKNSLAITDFHAKKTQHVQLFENPLPGTPPFAIPNQVSEQR